MAKLRQIVIDLPRTSILCDSCLTVLCNRF